jgi:hypothetical protein
MIKTFKNPKPRGTLSPSEDLTHVNPKSISVASRYKPSRWRLKSAKPQTKVANKGEHPEDIHRVRGLLETPLGSPLASPPVEKREQPRFDDKTYQDKKLM